MATNPSNGLEGDNTLQSICYHRGSLKLLDQVSLSLYIYISIYLYSYLLRSFLLISTISHYNKYGWCFNRESFLWRLLTQISKMLLMDGIIISEAPFGLIFSICFFFFIFLSEWFICLRNELGCCKNGGRSNVFCAFLDFMSIFSLRFVVRLFCYLIGIFQLVSNSSLNLSGWPYGRWQFEGRLPLLFQQHFLLPSKFLIWRILMGHLLKLLLSLQGNWIILFQGNRCVCIRHCACCLHVWFDCLFEWQLNRLIFPCLQMIRIGACPQEVKIVIMPFLRFLLGCS